ncbi:aminotransferase class V-fold PLP-dependent enzyme [Paralimibaculum aggregatum]|uniref:Cysteine desulfurase n=1 Tax=Paralimibaculum aggregatum TaxID=3036245 RepID=A0ABQ6LM99_9RHOB|nr:cysteine desulfurase family protein [Limibaculum sp. NKW23]GMG83576.1 aminotransferase class V-fold PLP-dependent enzyme [Limibaculum sp. NKW23]
MTGLAGRRAYLDWNASAPLRPEARAAMRDAMEVAGNPSSVHAEGRAARALVERSRAQVAALVGCEPAEIVFTSGATEGAGLLRHLPAGHAVFVEETAHDCLWAHLDLTGVENAEGGHTLAMGLANSETGLLASPGRDDGGWIWGARRAHWLFLDAVQHAGRLPLNLHALGADFAILSAHKLGGPRGCGALFVRTGLDISPLSLGGGQETGRRSGTENVIGIAGFGAAAEAARRDIASGIWADVTNLRDSLENTLAAAVPETIFVGRGSPRLPNTSCFATPGWKGETQVMAMDLAGFAVSAGSACSSGKVRESRVLRAMGHDEETARSAIRVSLGPTTTQAEVAAFADAWLAAYEKRRVRAA